MIDANNLIEKSKPLVWARFNNYTVNELKLLEVYLSRINARNPESCRVKFTKKEYCELMGLHPDTKTQQLKKYTRKFLGNVVTLDLENGYEQFTLFTHAVCKEDPELGQVCIELNCNPELSEVFFNIAEDGYIRYKLRNIIELSSQYSVRLYSLLKDKAYGNHEWIVNVKELRELLGATSKNYESFKEFNRAVLKKAEAEINDHTDIRFTYEKVMRGRITRAVKFKIQQLAEDNLPGQMNIYDYPEYLPDPKPQLTPKQHYENSVPADANPIVKSMIDFYAEACDYEFDYLEMDELSILAGDHVEYDPVMGVEGKQREVYKYLTMKYKTLCRKRKEGKVNSPFGYMKFLVENDK